MPADSALRALPDVPSQPLAALSGTSWGLHCVPAESFQELCRARQVCQQLQRLDVSCNPELTLPPGQHLLTSSRVGRGGATQSACEP